MQIPFKDIRYCKTTLEWICKTWIGFIKHECLILSTELTRLFDHRDQITLSTQTFVSNPHQRSTTVSLETNGTGFVKHGMV